MAFGLKRHELIAWKQAVENGEIAFMTHFWQDPRFPEATSVTKVGCKDIEKLKAWGQKHGLPATYIHADPLHPHFDLFPPIQKPILKKEGYLDQIERFNL
ncbi:hypothetical protein DES38_104297 [Streptohalobacillus salinus]|uniref:Uncharacterized protein n=1 Tax=Streptohalobacillus salinus TaxID=621096 RepID=A0A2V3WFD7_9BACI|nr:hypothetical protein [Streptohalobacillus salinus]PXW91861.1 hypothetical protein DES38_104297 [Streptohalobacillus salinus]